jgi:non-specific serine/threonine protein kinase
MNQALIGYADGVLALYGGEPARGFSPLERAVEVFSSNQRGYLYVAGVSTLGALHERAGDPKRAIEYLRQVLSITEACGESQFRSVALWVTGVAAWQQGEGSRAMQLLRQALQVTRRVRNPVVAALSLEAVAWIVCADGDAGRAATLMGAAQELNRSIDTPSSVLPMPQHHDECVQLARSTLGARAFDAAVQRGRVMNVDEAVAYALGEQPTVTAHTSGPGVALTKRERQVADFIAQGRTNKQIAAKLAISPRTADSHVEHILTKLGFTSRAQIAAWITEDAERQNR